MGLFVMLSISYAVVSMVRDSSFAENKEKSVKFVFCQTANKDMVQADFHTYNIFTVFTLSTGTPYLPTILVLILK